MPAERLLVGMPVGMAGCLLALLLTSSLFLGLCTCQELSVFSCFCVSLLALSWVCLLACCCPPGWPACACANSLPCASGLLLLCLGLMRGDKEHPQDSNLGIQLALRLRLASQILIQVEKSDMGFKMGRQCCCGPIIRKAAGPFFRSRGREILLLFKKKKLGARSAP